MKTVYGVVALTGVLACGLDADPAAVQLVASRFAGSAWSAPVNLGPLINTSLADANAFLSADEHTMYFVSARPGGSGSNDLWASHRRCRACDWEAPYSLGSSVNSAAADGSPTLSEDGRLLFFFTTRDDGFGSADIYVSRRLSTGAPGEIWSAPVNLGPHVNTADTENGSYWVREGSDPVLYFNRVPTGGSSDLYKVSLSPDGVPLGAAVEVTEFNSPLADQKVSFRTDGLEVFLSSTRTGTAGSFDIWTATRHTPQDPWPALTNVGAPINTPDIDSQPHLSRDGRTLIFTSNRAGGFGGNDLWMTTRRE
jgi:hypothetical protein